MLRFYLMPMIIDARNHRLEKYRDEMITAGIQWQPMAYGETPVFLMAAEVDATQHALLAAHADVSSFPQNLDAQLGANRQAVEDALEGHNIPGNWVTTAMTFRFVVRVLVGVIFISQRFRGMDQAAGGTGNLFQQGVTLNTTYNAMPLDYRTRLVDAAISIGYSVAGLTGASTLRDLLRSIGQQQSPIKFLGQEV